MSGNHLGHDGRKYTSLKAHDEADNKFDKTVAGRRGKGNSHRTRDGSWTEQEWDDWKAQWKTAPWDKKSTPTDAPADVKPAADGNTITERHDCGRFSC